MTDEGIDAIALGIVAIAKKVESMNKNRKKEEEIIKQIIKQIEALAKQHTVSLVRRACSRYAIRESEKARLSKEIRKREAELADLKRKHG